MSFPHGALRPSKGPVPALKVRPEPRHICKPRFHTSAPVTLGLTATRSPSDTLRSALTQPISGVRGWRGRAPRQPGQVRKEAAVTSPAWVVVQPLTIVLGADEKDPGCDGRGLCFSGERTCAVDPVTIPSKPAVWVCGIWSALRFTCPGIILRPNTLHCV